MPMGTHLTPLRSCCIWLGIQPKTQSPVLLQTACTSTMRKNKVKKKVITSLKLNLGKYFPEKHVSRSFCYRAKWRPLTCLSLSWPEKAVSLPEEVLRLLFPGGAAWFWFLCGGGCNVVQGSKLCNCTFITTVKTKLSKESIFRSARRGWFFVVF